MSRFFSFTLVSFVFFSLVSFAEPPSLTDDEKRTLDIGEISTEKQVLGGILGVIPGYGVGHLVQGRYEERGYIFTIGELASLGVLVVGAMGSHDCGSCGNHNSSAGNAVAVVGAAGFLTFKIWEAVDVWMVGGHNEKVRALREKTGEKPISKNREKNPRFFIIPTGSGGGLAGIALHF